MGKISKKVWLILIIVVLALPMFVGCEPEPEPVDYKAEFLKELKNEVKDSGVATLTYTGDNLTVAFTNSNLAAIRSAAEGLVTTFKGKVDNTSELVLGDDTFKLNNALDLDAVKTKILSLTSGNHNGTFAYKVNVKNYQGQNFTLSGEVTISGL